MGFWSKLLGARTPQEKEEEWRESAKLELKDQRDLADRLAGIPNQTVEIPGVGIYPLFDPVSPEGRDVLEQAYKENPTYPRWKINNAYSRTFTQAYKEEQPASGMKITQTGKVKQGAEKLFSHMPQTLDTERKRQELSDPNRQVLDAYKTEPGPVPINVMKTVLRKGPRR